MNIQQHHGGTSETEFGRNRCALCGAPAGRWVDASVWERDDMRRALAGRDIGQVYRLLQRHGASQRAIAARTGQSQSEISEIVAGRKVNAYDVLLRIADGLAVPRGWLGLAYANAGPGPDEIT